MRELELQSLIIKGMKKQGWYATKTSDRFIAGKPDLRVGHADFGQLDIELKVVNGPVHREVETGLTKLQMATLRSMNEHGMPAVCLVFSSHLGVFYCANVLRATLPTIGYCVLKLPRPLIVDGPDLFTVSTEYLHDLGYKHLRGKARSIPGRKP